MKYFEVTPSENAQLKAANHRLSGRMLVNENFIYPDSCKAVCEAVLSRDVVLKELNEFELPIEPA